MVLRERARHGAILKRDVDLCRRCSISGKLKPVSRSPECRMTEAKKLFTVRPLSAESVPVIPVRTKSPK